MSDGNVRERGDGVKVVMEEMEENGHYCSNIQPNNMKQSCNENIMDGKKRRLERISTI